MKILITIVTVVSLIITNNDVELLLLFLLLHISFSFVLIEFLRQFYCLDLRLHLTFDSFLFTSQNLLLLVPDCLIFLSFEF
jgi:hypothetical protein